MSDDINVLTEQGQQAINEARYTKAVILYTQFLALDPESVTAYANRGFARYVTGDNEGAIEDYEEALKRSPDLPPVLNNRGLAKTALGDLDGALKDFNQILESDPEYALAFNNRGHVWVKLAERDYQRAEEIFSELSLTDPDAAQARKDDGDNAEIPTFPVKKVDSERLVNSFEVLDRGDHSGGAAAREVSREVNREKILNDHRAWVTTALAVGVDSVTVAVACVSCHLPSRGPGSGGGRNSGE